MSGPQRSGKELTTAEIERLMPLHREADGIMLDSEIVSDLAAFGRANVDEVFDPDSWARREYEDYQRARAVFRRRNASAVQLALPDPDAIVQLGDNTSILLRDCRRNHLTKYKAMLRDEKDAQDIAYARKIVVIDEALRRMLSDEDTYIDVMSKDYGEDDG